MREERPGGGAEDSGGYREHLPVPALQPFVACYWTRRTAGSGPAHRVLPDGAIDIVFDLERVAAMAVGTMTGPLVVPRSNRDDFLGVRFRPGRAAAYLHLDAIELTDRRVALGDLWGAAGGRLLGRLASAHSARERFRVLEHELTSRLAVAGPTDPYVDAVVASAMERGGAIDLGEMQRRTGVSAAWLRRGFRRHVGTGPKFFCRVVRLQAALARARRERRPSWASVAADHAFADQAHLVREFSALAGLAPARLLAEARRP